MSQNSFQTNLIGKKATLTRRVGVHPLVQRGSAKLKEAKAWAAGKEVEIVYARSTVYSVIFGLLASDGSIREATSESIRVKIDVDPFDTPVGDPQ